MPTLDWNTGGIVSGFDEALQSLQIAITTRKGTRVERRDYGSDVPSLVDAPISPLTLIDYYQAIAEAVRLEPRFRLSSVSLSDESNLSAGNPIFDIEVIYYPRGHLGDYSEAVTKRGRIVLSDSDRRP